MPVAAEASPAVAIVGGGPAGMALALALKLHGVTAEIFEARERAAVLRDPRVLAPGQTGNPGEPARGVAGGMTSARSIELPDLASPDRAAGL